MVDKIIPQFIKVLGKNVEIDFNDSTLEELGLLGRASSPNLKIELTSNQAMDQVKDTLLHEVLHLISSFQALELEENTVIRLSTAFMDLLVNNKKLVRFLVS